MTSSCGPKYAAAAPDILNYDLQRERDIDLGKSSSGLDFSGLIRGKGEEDSRMITFPKQAVSLIARRRGNPRE